MPKTTLYSYFILPPCVGLRSVNPFNKRKWMNECVLRFSKWRVSLAKVKKFCSIVPPNPSEWDRHFAEWADQATCKTSLFTSEHVKLSALGNETETKQFWKQFQNCFETVLKLFETTLFQFNFNVRTVFINHAKNILFGVCMNGVESWNQNFKTLHFKIIRPLRPNWLSGV